MVRQSQQEQRLLELLNSPANRNRCGECKAHNPTWASWNLGIFLCGRCASAHRSLGSDISQVKSLSMENWSSHELAVMEKMGNKRNNSFWNEKHIPFPYDPDDKDSLVMWLRDKYTGKFRYGPVKDSDYNLDDSWGDTTDDYGFDNSRRSSNGGKKSNRLSSALGLNYVGPNRRREQSMGSSSKSSFFDNDESGHGFGYTGNNNSSSNVTRSMRRGMERNGQSRYDDSDDYDGYFGSSRSDRGKNSRYSSPTESSNRSNKLTFRRPTTSEYRKYGDQSRKMKFDMGYEDEDVNIEALALCHGNIPRAVDILKQNGVRPSSAGSINSEASNKFNGESKPSLPKRKESAGAIFDSSKAGGFNWLDETIEESTNKSTAADNQIYQYVDPNTGQYYYIDANGQQYVDPNQQQLQQQQTMANPFQQPQQPTAQVQQQQILQQQQQQMMPGFVQPTATDVFPTATPGVMQGTQTGFQQPQGEPTLNQLALQKQQQQQMLQQQLMQQQLLQQQQQQQQQFTQQPNYFTGF